jgi:hypothetical protein
MKIVENN